MWREPRLQRKLLAWLLGPLAVLLVLDTAAAYWTSLHFANLAHDRPLLDIGREIALHVRQNGVGAHLELAPQAEAVLLGDAEDRLSYRVAADDGQFLGGATRLPPPPRPVRPGSPPVFYAATVDGGPVRVVAAWMPVEGAVPPRQVYVQVAETLNKRIRLIWEMVASAVLPQLLVIAAAAALVWLGVSRGLAPLRRLRRAVSDRSHVDLSPVAVDGVPGEVRPLVDEVNALMQRLGQTLDFQNRFVADAAHQLKTPVSGLKAQIELALREEDPARVRHSLAQLYLSADRLSRLVRQLLALARNEPGAVAAVQLRPLDLDAFALEASMEWVPLALKARVDLGFEGAGTPLWIEADAERLRELVNNLVDNAVRYSRAGGRVTVGVGAAGTGEVRLFVNDDGPRIPVEERQRIFERFHRLLGTDADGSGLGLAIVSEIAALHGARITLEEDASDGVGNTFSVFFPLRAPGGGLPPLVG